MMLLDTLTMLLEMMAGGRMIREAWILDLRMRLEAIVAWDLEMQAMLVSAEMA